jgi:hypothetical protein
MTVSGEFKYKSTKDGSPPSGYSLKGTFRDVSLTGLKPEHIDRIDTECLEQQISRFGWIMNARSTREGNILFHQLFVGVKHRGWAKRWKQLDEELKADHS